MDPESITALQWTKIREIIFLLWFFLASMVAFGGSFLVAQAILPSLVYTGHLSRRALRLRPLLYLVALVALGMAGFLLARALTQLGIIRDIYPRYWM